MQAGLLREVVTLQSQSSTQDSFGQRVTTWTDVATVRAQVQALSGRELVNAQSIHAEVSTQVMIRYRTAVTAAMRVLYRGRVLNVHAVLDPEERRIVLHLMCSEGMNAG